MVRDCRCAVRQGGNGLLGACIECSMPMRMLRDSSGAPGSVVWGCCRVGPVVGASGTRVSWSGLSCHIDAAMVPHRTRHHPALGLKTTVRKTPNLIFVENGKWGGKSRRENEVDITGYRKQNILIGNMPVTIGGTPTHVTI